MVTGKLTSVRMRSETGGLISRACAMNATSIYVLNQSLKKLQDYSIPYTF